MFRSESDYNNLNNLYKEKFEKDPGYFMLKRFMDVFLSVFSLIVFSPLLLLTALAIKLDSKGPVLFLQERVGLNEQHFIMYKFRTMCMDAEEKFESIKEKNEMSGPMFKIKNDPRVTNVGKMLRKTSLDELPQLINIIKGDMSLVGPRPSLPREVEKFTSEQRKRFLAKPGLTCYWQVMGRNKIDFEEWMRLDLKYVEERCTWLDIKLIFMTMGVFFGDPNAS
ncbi:MAG: sugar transferase [Clostridiaceae bacterium]